MKKSRKPRKKTLTSKEMIFVHELMKGASGADAYRTAYKPKSTNIHTHNRNAKFTRERPAVAAYLKELQDRAEEEAVMTRVEALKILTRIGRGELRNFLNESGALAPDAVRKSGPELQSLTVSESYTEDGGMVKKTDIKLRDPIRAIERMAKMQDWDKAKELAMDGVTFILNTGSE